jgi:prefoldin subunit 5
LSNYASGQSVRDAALSARIDSVANNVSQVSNALSNEISNRTSADNVLSAQIASVNSQLASSISNVRSIMSQGISVVSAALASEISNRISADNVLSAQIASVNSQLASTISQLNSVVSQLNSSFSNVRSAVSNVSTVSGAGSATGLQAVVDALANRISIASGLASAADVKASNAQSDLNSTRSQLLSMISQTNSVLSQHRSTVNDHTDVSIASPVSLQALRYASAAGQWTNQAVAGGGGSGSQSITSALSLQLASVKSQHDSAISDIRSVLSQMNSVVSNHTSAISQLNSVVSQLNSTTSVLQSKFSLAVGQSVQLRSVTGTQSFATSTLANISGMSVSVEAAGTYRIEGQLMLSASAATVGVRVAVTFPAARDPFGYLICQLGYALLSVSDTQAVFSTSPRTVLSSPSVIGGAKTPLRFDGEFRASAAGVFQLQIAGTSSTAVSPIHVKSGSWIRAIRTG